MQTRMTVLLVLAFAACSKSGPAPEGKKVDPAGALAEFDLAAVAKKFDGKTFVITTSVGKQVWSFANDKVTIFDGQTEKVGDLEVRSPCGLVVRTKRSDGLEDLTEKTFAWNGDTLHMGAGYGGAKRGDTYVGCWGAVDVYVLTGGSCKLGSTAGRASWAPAKCAVDGNKLVTDNVTYEIVGDALVDSTLKGAIAEVVPSLADGKAKLAAQ